LQRGNVHSFAFLPLLTIGLCAAFS